MTDQPGSAGSVGLATSDARDSAETQGDASAAPAAGEHFAQVALSFAGVSRSFPGVQALDDVSLEVRVG